MAPGFIVGQPRQVRVGDPVAQIGRACIGKADAALHLAVRQGCTFRRFQSMIERDPEFPLRVQWHGGHGPIGQLVCLDHGPLPRSIVVVPAEPASKHRHCTDDVMHGSRGFASVENRQQVTPQGSGDVATNADHEYPVA